MKFKYRDVSLEFDDRWGFVHPQTGERVPTARECLKAWREPDPAKRQQWVTLIQMIERMMEGVEAWKIGNTREVVFDEVES
ncbi:MAG: hypothetical protein KQJ78_18140 [Deltaproteobacteria bacterium]|nr:hypothetical protein [Deltaproteobacteria bacterium]